MDYYNSSLKKFDRSNFEYLNHGSCAHVAHNHDIIFKQYYSNVPLSDRLKVCIFEILKDINNSHFIELIDIYAEGKLLKLIFYKIIKKILIIDAYTAKYYKSEKINVLYAPTDYFLDNIREIETLFGIFSNNAILTDDLHVGNIIFTSNNMIIIDPDFFKLYEKKDIVIKNKRRLLSLCSDIFSSMLELESQYTEEEINNFVRRLTDFNVNENTDITYEFNKKLKQVKRPIQLLTKTT